MNTYETTNTNTGKELMTLSILKKSKSILDRKTKSLSTTNHRQEQYQCTQINKDNSKAKPILKISTSLPSIPFSLLHNILASTSAPSLSTFSSILLSSSVSERYSHSPVNSCTINKDITNQLELLITKTTIEMPSRTVRTNTTKDKRLMICPNSTSSKNADDLPPKPTGLRRSHSEPILKTEDAATTCSNSIEATEMDCDKRFTFLDSRNKIKSAETSSQIAKMQIGVTKSNNTAQNDARSLNYAQLRPISGNGCADNAPKDCNQIQEDLRFGCAHYKRRAMFVTPCCNKFYKCRFCHDENESHHFDRKTLNELICSECNTRQGVQEACTNCGVRFGKYTCLICNLFDDSDKKQYHCDACGICRVGGAENFFHCAVCNMCLPIRLKINGHKCVENISRSHCPVCLGDIHTSRIPCHIPDCGHLLHKMCFDQLLASGHYACPTCQTSLIDMTALWEFLDAQAARAPMPKKYDNQKIHIFCNDCQKTSKTNFHFIGLKCMECGAYNTTQDVKRRVSLVTDETNTA